MQQMLTIITTYIFAFLCRCFYKKNNFKQNFLPIGMQTYILKLIFTNLIIIRSLTVLICSSSFISKMECHFDSFIGLLYSINCHKCPLAIFCVDHFFKLIHLVSLNVIYIGSQCVMCCIFPPKCIICQLTQCSSHFFPNSSLPVLVSVPLIHSIIIIINITTTVNSQNFSCLLRKKSKNYFQYHIHDNSCLACLLHTINAHSQLFLYNGFPTSEYLF